MTASAVETQRRQLFRRSWGAAGVGTGTVAAAGFFALWGVLSEFEFCVGGCPAEESAVGATAIALFVLAGALLVGGLCWTAWVSRGTVRDALVHGVVATGAFAAALLLIWAPFGAGGFAPGFVLAVGAASVIVVREPIPLARYLRIAAIVLLTLATTLDDNLALVLFALLVFPAVGVMDTVALRLEADRER